MSGCWPPLLNDSESDFVTSSLLLMSGFVGTEFRHLFDAPARIAVPMFAPELPIYQPESANSLPRSRGEESLVIDGAGLGVSPSLVGNGGAGCVSTGRDRASCFGSSCHPRSAQEAPFLYSSED
jgi:hypothetical protein